MKMITRLLAIGALLSTATPALAVPIIYTGSQQASSIFANYSIQTDGTIGQINASNILSFSVTLSDVISTYTFGSATGAQIDGALIATEINLSVERNGFNLTQPSQAGPFSGVLSFSGRNRPESLGYVFAQIADAAGARTGASTYSDPIATSAVPEPASWAMMVGGLGLSGAAMRRRQKVGFRSA